MKWKEKKPQARDGPQVPANLNRSSTVVSGKAKKLFLNKKKFICFKIIFLCYQIVLMY